MRGRAPSADRSCLARQLWDQKYDELVAAVGLGPPGRAKAESIVEEAFVCLLARWLPPRDPMAYLEHHIETIRARRLGAQVPAQRGPDGP